MRFRIFPLIFIVTVQSVSFTLAQEKRIGAIEIFGNKKTVKKAILAEIFYKSGDAYTERVPAEIQRRLMNLGYFQYVKVSPEFRADKVDLKIELKERTTYGIYPIVDIRKGDDIYGVEIAENNIFGLGKAISASYLRSGNTNSLSISYFDRHLIWSNFMFGVGLFDRECITKWYDTAGNLLSETKLDSGGGYLQMGYWFSYTTKGFLGFLTKKDEYSLKRGNYKPEDGRINKSTLALLYDDTSYGIYTLKGSAGWIMFQKGHKFLGGDFSFEKLSLGVVGYLNTTKDHTMILKGALGRGWNLPAEELFSLGGAGSLRGYDPGDCKGRRFFLTSIEYRFPFQRLSLGRYSATLGILGFIDAGYAWKDSISISDIKVGIGCGLRLYLHEIQRGVIGLDLGYGFETRDIKFYLSFGTTF